MFVLWGCFATFPTFPAIFVFGQWACCAIGAPFPEACHTFWPTSGKPTGKRKRNKNNTNTILPRPWLKFSFRSSEHVAQHVPNVAPDVGQHVANQPKKRERKAENKNPTATQQSYSTMAAQFFLVPWTCCATFWPTQNQKDSIMAWFFAVEMLRNNLRTKL